MPDAGSTCQSQAFRSFHRIAAQWLGADKGLASGSDFAHDLHMEIVRQRDQHHVDIISRDRIGQVHFRNVVLRKPRLDYVETFPDDGDNDMYEVMKVLVRNNYKRLIFPEHPRNLDTDKLLAKEAQTTNSGWAYNVGHCRAMLQIALRELKGM